MKVLGVRPAGDVAWLAIVDEGVVMAIPDRFELNHEPRPASLLSGLEQAEMLLRENSIDAIAVADAHSNVRPKSLKEARRRLILESLLEIAAARADINYQVLSPHAIQVALDLPTRKIEDHVDAVVAKSGTRWSQRGVAAVAAIALSRREQDS
jgi:hypothetical protein